MDLDQRSKIALARNDLLEWLKLQIAADELNVTLKHENGKDYYDRKDSKGRPDYYSCRCVAAGEKDCGGKWSVITEIPKNLKGGWLPCNKLIRKQEKMYESRIERLKKVKPQLEQLGINMEQRISDAESEKRDTLRAMKQRRHNEHIFHDFFLKKAVEDTPENNY